MGPLRLWKRPFIKFSGRETIPEGFSRILEKITNSKGTVKWDYLNAVEKKLKN